MIDYKKKYLKYKNKYFKLINNKFKGGATINYVLTDATKWLKLRFNGDPYNYSTSNTSDNIKAAQTNECNAVRENSDNDVQHNLLGFLYWLDSWHDFLQGRANESLYTRLKKVMAEDDDIKILLPDDQLEAEHLKIEEKKGKPGGDEHPTYKPYQDHTKTDKKILINHYLKDIFPGKGGFWKTWEKYLGQIFAGTVSSGITFEQGIEAFIEAQDCYDIQKTSEAQIWECTKANIELDDSHQDSLKSIVDNMEEVNNKILRIRFPDKEVKKELDFLKHPKTKKLNILTKKNLDKIVVPLKKLLGIEGFNEAIIGIDASSGKFRSFFNEHIKNHSKNITPFSQGDSAISASDGNDDNDDNDNNSTWGEKKNFPTNIIIGKIDMWELKSPVCTSPHFIRWFYKKPDPKLGNYSWEKNKWFTMVVTPSSNIDTTTDKFINNGVVWESEFKGLGAGIGVTMLSFLIEQVHLVENNPTYKENFTNRINTFFKVFSNQFDISNILINLWEWGENNLSNDANFWKQSKENPLNTPIGDNLPLLRNIKIFLILFLLDYKRAGDYEQIYGSKHLLEKQKEDTSQNSTNISATGDIIAGVVYRIFKIPLYTRRSKDDIIFGSFKQLDYTSIIGNLQKNINDILGKLALERAKHHPTHITGDNAKWGVSNELGDKNIFLKIYLKLIHFIFTVISTEENAINAIIDKILNDINDLQPPANPAQHKELKLNNIYMTETIEAQQEKNKKYIQQINKKIEFLYQIYKFIFNFDIDKYVEKYNTPLKNKFKKIGERSNYVGESKPVRAVVQAHEQFFDMSNLDKKNKQDRITVEKWENKKTHLMEEANKSYIVFQKNFTDFKNENLDLLFDIEKIYRYIEFITLPIPDLPPQPLHPFSKWTSNKFKKYHTFTKNMLRFFENMKSQEKYIYYRGGPPTPQDTYCPIFSIGMETNSAFDPTPEIEENIKNTVISSFPDPSDLKSPPTLTNITLAINSAATSVCAKKPVDFWLEGMIKVTSPEKNDDDDGTEVWVLNEEPPQKNTLENFLNTQLETLLLPNASPPPAQGGGGGAYKNINIDSKIDFSNLTIKNKMELVGGNIAYSWLEDDNINWIIFLDNIFARISNMSYTNQMDDYKLWFPTEDTEEVIQGALLEALEDKKKYIHKKKHIMYAELQNIIFDNLDDYLKDLVDGYPLDYYIDLDIILDYKEEKDILETVLGGFNEEGVLEKIRTITNGVEVQEKISSFLEELKYIKFTDATTHDKLKKKAEEIDTILVPYKDGWPEGAIIIRDYLRIKYSIFLRDILKENNPSIIFLYYILKISNDPEENDRIIEYINKAGRGKEKEKETFLNKIVVANGHLKNLDEKLNKTQDNDERNILIKQNKIFLDTYKKIILNFKEQVIRFYFDMYKIYTKDYDKFNNNIVHPLRHLLDKQLVYNEKYIIKEKQRCEQRVVN